jgi:hypothetical protein
MDKDTEELLKTNSENLASMIVIYRVLGIFKEEAKLCMIELMKRKENDDDFDFESFINENVDKHQIKLNIPTSKEIKFNVSREITKVITSMLTNQLTS